MKFVAVSDTHDNVFAIRDLLDEVKKERFEFLVHAGDVVAPFALREFEKLNKKIYIAFGNNDGDRNLLMGVIERNGWIAADIVPFPGGVAYHGTDANVIEVLKKLKVEYLITGHTHEARIERGGITGGITILNPGEVCGYLTGKRSYAIVEDGDVSIVEF
ncbi:metallophosphoesterase [Archaeoglobales archaeon]|nr:MAG: metallophosphoesterase [Archaeoglobales archaeon]